MVRSISADEIEVTRYGHEIAAQGLQVKVGRRTLAVGGVDLALGPGVHGLLGPNGAGKTSLIRTLATALTPSGGSLELLGRRVDGHGLRLLRREIGYLPQDFGYYKKFTAREFVEYMAWLKEVPPSAVPDAVQRALTRVGLADRADAKMKTLSGGMIRRVGIAQAIVNDPRILLLDEPTVGLDPDQRLRLRELLTEIGTQSCVLVCTHLVEDVAAACDSVILMAAGKIVYEGTPHQLAAAAGPDSVGDSPIERGYSALLHPAGRRDSW